MIKADNLTPGIRILDKAGTIATVDRLRMISDRKRRIDATNDDGDAVVILADRDDCFHLDD
jgi:hypothetical protein